MTNCPNYDALNRPTEWEQTRPGGTYALSHYKYDLANREVATWRWEDQDKGERFNYDPANQLTKAWYSAANVSNLNLVPQNAQRTTTYAYTPNKLNRSTMTETTDPSGAGGTVTSYTPNALNQYTTVGAATYTYNDNFNLTQAEGFSGTYDAANHLVTASHTSPSATVDFVYDGLGRCVKRSVNNVGTIFVYDGWKPIGEFDHDYFQAWNVYGPGADEIIVRQRDGIGYTWFELDRHGNVVFLLNNDGTLIEKYTYDAFGRAKVTDRNGGNPSLWSNYLHDFLFQGREYIQELGIYDYRNRFYQPATGRFLQTDPTGFDGGDMNLFRYCNDDPIDGSDPMGLSDVSFIPEWQRDTKKQIDDRKIYRDVIKVSAHATSTYIINTNVTPAAFAAFQNKGVQIPESMRLDIKDLVKYVRALAKYKPDILIRLDMCRAGDMAGARLTKIGTSVAEQAYKAFGGNPISANTGDIRVADERVWTSDILLDSQGVTTTKPPSPSQTPYYNRGPSLGAGKSDPAPAYGQLSALVSTGGGGWSTAGYFPGGGQEGEGFHPVPNKN